MDCNHCIMSAFFQFIVGTGSFFTEWYDALSITMTAFSCLGNTPQNHGTQNVSQIISSWQSAVLFFFFFDSKHNRLPSTKPCAEPIWTTIKCFPLPDGFLRPVDSLFRNTISVRFYRRINPCLTATLPCVYPRFIQEVYCTTFLSISSYILNILLTPYYEISSLRKCAIPLPLGVFKIYLGQYNAAKRYEEYSEDLDHP